MQLAWRERLASVRLQVAPVIDGGGVEFEAPGNLADRCAAVESANDSFTRSEIAGRGREWRHRRRSDSDFRVIVSGPGGRHASIEARRHPGRIRSDCGRRDGAQRRDGATATSRVRDGRSPACVVAVPMMWDFFVFVPIRQ